MSRDPICLCDVLATASGVGYSLADSGFEDRDSRRSYLLGRNQLAAKTVPTKKAISVASGLLRDFRATAEGVGQGPSIHIFQFPTQRQSVSEAARAHPVVARQLR